ncbi:hypothetical protein QQY66_21610 [Streptomyces sp. DG2A-72]|uniref:hypothetical protein n=1 Tax=Streptomyces sp. DG2A-72 TaxID=3051386 RepID=UPI00265BC454|nr:hypothetical protein [Streptomyces sp. DG2A-72]MDO0934159.1 hypothetical protein [Streptomyces sp. DG2A-72]
MIGRQKIATISGLVGTLAVIYGGAGQVYAAVPSHDCKTSAQGDITCVRKSETARKGKDGTVVQQKHDCSTVERPRLVFPQHGMGNSGTTRVGPVVDCSNKVELPKGFKLPKFDF